ncbi:MULTISPECIES: hypothetical protein [Burkholderia cepacia complex]|uniref:hypothetical protein n=1 Tax=Burkholderia cenocepacia TaxID=95486 RepID=UPI002238CD12|nr:hypothetical protein [Burkholderia cenocepacia]MCW5156385.1 hypothetical protein [Burkholderia cenocepacia]
MAQSLDQFVAEVQKDITGFAAAYKKKAEEMPELYPLTIEDGNEGMWFEFFQIYCQSGEV